MAGTDFSHLTNDELIKGIQALNLPDYIRSKAYGIDVRETLAQMTEMTIQLGVNMGLSPDDALAWARKLQETVSQSEFDSWVATLLDGGPSIFMNTLSELQSTYPNGASGVALVRETDPAKIYVWNGSAWEDFGDYQGIEIKDGSVNTVKVADKAITTGKTDFIESQDNLFNGWNDRFYLAGDSTVLTYTPSNTSYYGTILQIDPNANYQIRLEDGFSGLFKYGTDSRTNFTSAQNLNGSIKRASNQGLVETVFKFTSGATDNYLYITSDTDVAMNVSKVANQGGRFVETLRPVEFKNVTPTNIEGVGIRNDSIPIGKLEHNTSANVFNYRTITEGYYVDRYTGNLMAGANNSVSDYIPIKVGKTKITFDKVTVGNINYAFYKNRNFIEGGQILVTDLTAPKTVPINILADEFRFSIANANNLNTYQVEFGETLSQSSEYFNYPKGLVMPKFDSNETEIHLSENKAVITMGDTVYTIEHEVTPFTDGGLYQNKDTWRIVDCSINGLKAYQSGAWETAIQVEGLPDFMGTFHGYEGTDSVGFYADNKKITSGSFSANEVFVVVRGKIFRHGTSDDVVATFTRLYTFKDGELKLNQKFNWLAEFELINAYLAMQPIKRTVNDNGTGSNITTTVLTDLDYKEYDISSVNSSLPIKNYVNGVKFAQIWGRDVGASILVETEDGDVDIYLWQAPQYNKIYFTYKRNSHIAIGDKWNFTTTYKVK